MTDYKVTGGCLCGGVKFEITKAPSQVHRCHCSMCRKVIGADYGTFGAVPKEHFKFIKKESLKEYFSSADVIRCFCSVCGCSLLGKPRDGGIFAHMEDVYVSFGSLDGDPGAPVEFHIFVKDKAPWVKINDSLPQADGYELLDLESPKK